MLYIELQPAYHSLIFQIEVNFGELMDENKFGRINLTVHIC